MDGMNELGRRAKEAARAYGGTGEAQKNRILAAIADGLEAGWEAIVEENRQDVAAAREAGIRPSMIDRLSLSRERIYQIAQATREVAALPDPVGKVDFGVTRPNGLRIRRVRVPLGAIGIIYEARPNVTVDAAALCLKSGNVCLLRGGKEAIRSNKALVQVMRRALEQEGACPDAVQLVEDTSRQSAKEMMALNRYLDVLIPRGGPGLIRTVVENSSVPVIQTGVGNCHIYVDSPCDLEMAVRIVDNAKTSRPSVCNAAETLLVHRDVAGEFLPMAARALQKSHTQLRGCPRTMEILKEAAIPATEEDYATEFEDYILAIRVVDSLDEALEHIARYSTGHSEAIVTDSYPNSRRFLEEVDAAAVYVNASTRFTDGGEFGFGAEIGISTQKLHARGPMGLPELTTVKYQIEGSGQIR